MRASRLQDGGGRRGAPAVPDPVRLLHDRTDFDLTKLAIEEGYFEHTSVRRYRRKSRVALSA